MMSDLREPMRIKRYANFLSKYTKTPSDRIEKKGSLLLTIYFLTMVHSGFLNPANIKNALKYFTPDIVLNHPFLEDE